MSAIQIYLDFKKYTTHLQLVQELSPACSAAQNDEVYIEVSLDMGTKYLYSDFLTLVVSVVTDLRRRGVRIIGKVLKADWSDDKIRYAMRVDFFHQIGAEVPEDFIRHDGSGRFTEISEFDKDSIYVLQNKINLILLQNVIVDVQVRRMLYYCLNEIMDNVLIHSQKPNGWACAQFFPYRKEIRIVIVDAGIGIYESLLSNPQSKYANITQKEALNLCVQRTVTNGKGLGFGLFATSQFIRENKGALVICSGDAILQNTLQGFSVNDGPYWKGTIVFLKINTNIPVNYQEIMPPNHSLSDDYQEYVEKSLDLNDNLW